MAICRSPRYTVHGAWRWFSWFLLLMGLSACGVANLDAANRPAAHLPTPAPGAPQEPPATVVTVQLTTPAATAAAMPAWQTYKSALGEYTVEYPAGWTVREQTGVAGTITTMSTPSGGGAKITVVIRAAVPSQQEPPDLPNTRCQQVSDNRGIATRCLDTLARTTSTTFVAEGRTYTITTTEKGMDQNVYQHVLDTFAPAAPATGQFQTDLEPLLLQPGDFSDTIAGARADDPTPLNFENAPPATRIVGLRLTHDERGAGSVSVLLYDAPADLAQAYQSLTASVLADAGQAIGAPLPPEIGEKAVAARLTLASSTYGPNHVAVIVFARCHALVDIRLNERADMTMDMAVAYAKRLDHRIAAVVCR